MHPFRNVIVTVGWDSKVSPHLSGRRTIELIYLSIAKFLGVRLAPFPKGVKSGLMLTTVDRTDKYVLIDGLVPSEYLTSSHVPILDGHFCRPVATPSRTFLGPEMGYMSLTPTTPDPPSG